MSARAFVWSAVTRAEITQPESARECRGHGRVRSDCRADFADYRDRLQLRGDRHDLTGTIPIFTVLLGALRLGQSVRPRHVLGLAVAMGGIVLATGGAGAMAGSGSATTVLGDLILLQASICIAGYYVFSAEVALRVGVLQVSAWSTIFAAVYSSPVAIWTVSSGQIHPTGTAIGVVAYLSVLVTVLG
ncbi:MAG: DMT family transporter, partial [Acetobacteraceae bacterium]|nr:DMT family transporter [Acetobacteraceae bacterium]